MLGQASQPENISYAVEAGRHRGNIPVTGSERRWVRSQMTIVDINQLRLFSPTRAVTGSRRVLLVLCFRQ